MQADTLCIGSMKVSKKTPFIDIALFCDYIKDSSKKELTDKAEEELGGCWDLTFREFFELSRGNFECKGIDLSHPEKLTVLQYYWCERFKAFVDEFSATLDKLQAPQSIEAQKASQACLDVTFEESVLIFCREYFNLHCFADVYGITLGEFLIAKKDVYNKTAFERAMSKIQEQKYKKK